MNVNWSCQVRNHRGNTDVLVRIVSILDDGFEDDFPPFDIANFFWCIREKSGMLWLKIIDSPRIGWFQVPSMANHLCPRRKVPQWRGFQSMHLAHWTSGFPSRMWYLWDLVGSDGQPTNSQIIQHVVLLNGETDSEKDFIGFQDPYEVGVIPCSISRFSWILRRTPSRTAWFAPTPAVSTLRLGGFGLVPKWRVWAPNLWQF